MSRNQRQITINMIREFKIPAIVWQSENCREMVRERNLLYEPPITQQLTDQELQSHIDLPFSTEVQCHSQAVGKI